MPDVVPTPTSRDVEPVGEPQTVPTVPETPAAPPPDSGIQNRINQLVKQRHEAERASSSLQAENERLSEQVMAMAEKVDALSRRATDTPRNDPAALSGFASAPATQGFETDFEGSVERAVQKVLGPVADQMNQSQASQVLLSEQTRSFEEAAVDLPNVAVKGSKEMEMFNQIWEGAPEIQAMPQGPAFVIHAVRGLLGDPTNATLADREVEERKIAATSPAPTGLDRLPSLGASKDAKRQEMIDILAVKAETQGWTEDEFTTYLGLKTGRLQPK